PVATTKASAAGEELLRDPIGLHQSEYSSQRALGLQLDSGDFPLVSVIIRSMDRDILATALDSVALQTYANIEVVLVNARGAPHRDVGEWCGRFPLRLIEPGKRLERSAACNAGLDAARGELLVFLDDDDYFLPHHVARLQHELARNEQAIAAYAAVQCIDPDGGEVRRYAESFDRVRLSISNYIPIHALLFRRSALAQGARFDESLPVCEDWDFWLQLLERGPFRFVAETGAVYRIHADGGSGVWVDHDRTRRVMIQILRRRIPAWDDELFWDVFERTHYKVRYDELAGVHAQLEREFQERTANDAARLRSQDAVIADLRHAIAAKDAALEHHARVEEAMTQAIHERDQRIAALYASTSWVVTKPLRLLSRLVRRLLQSRAEAGAQTQAAVPAQQAPQVHSAAPAQSAPPAQSALPSAVPSQPAAAAAAPNPYIYDIEHEPGPAPFICELIGNDKRVLEIGCGPGTMTKLLKNRMASRVTGMEVDEQAIELAREWCEDIHRVDLNAADWPEVVGSAPVFDTVLAADVLEHLYDPWAVLKQMATLMAPDGNIVVSLPHAGHAAIAACLVNSDVRYSHSGLLDRTHIRFFGLTNIEELFTQAGLKIVAVRHVLRKPEETELAKNWETLSESVRAALRASPHADIYQVVVKAVPLDRPEPAVPLI
ncbi:MAG: bifunctional glycosyltransferase/class I SAM-dependent methyltransferase, partial [Pseudomonadota bacterium]|nr:bifunctional glycosyltransferase/class I SAM-dependent methyltransferase [Pseudomonadota bacterium]